ncbi:hypothetical protein BACCOP_01928 [Phocaeicola coprocola DSM 17136]|uniref:Uncharacterized protein n=1 Tax=Phocaeicola coprocola DSM 17136 TaxID=470145 RepID=B3JJ63_9BACT|nr:hypothetical protein BACCOP_01928 [Phocaeicola coprocola DSM 17136]
MSYSVVTCYCFRKFNSLLSIITHYPLSVVSFSMFFTKCPESYSIIIL